MSEEKFKQTVLNTIYYNIYKIKIKLLLNANKKNSHEPKYTVIDFEDSKDIATVSTCNTLLNFLNCFKKK